jgi:hypothetical protein
VDAKRRHFGLHYLPFTTFCRCSPNPSIPSVTTSPAFKNFGGFMLRPTPGGDPVTRG